MIKNKLVLPLAVVFLTALTVQAEKLVINSNQSNPAGKDALHQGGGRLQEAKP